MLEDIIEAWRTNHRINLFLIDKISDEGMHCTLSKYGGRDVALQFAHMHNVRVWHLEKRARELSLPLEAFPSKVQVTKEQLRSALRESAQAVESFLSDLSNGIPKRRAFKKGLVNTLSYFIAHESHHRGSILLTLKQCGHKLDQMSQYAIWNWDKM